MEIFEVKYDNAKITRKLPKSWKLHSKNTSEQVYGNLELAHYCKKLYNSFVGIKKYDEKKFNANNSWTIDEYIDIFNLLYKQIFDALINKKMAENFFNFQSNSFYKNNDKNQRFNIFEHIKTYKKSAFVFEKDGDDDKVVGFSEKTFKIIKPLVKKLFMLEKMCAFTTRKFWKEELTPYKDLDLSKKYKILVKVVFSQNWRTQKLTKSLKNYYDNRIYSSTSLVDQNSTDKVFKFFAGNDIYSLLLMDFDENTYICSSEGDSYSEEEINNKNPLLSKAKYTNIFLQDIDNTDGKIHKLYADAVETLTPNIVLHNIISFSEVNIKNAKPVAVISPNKKSLSYSKNKAKELNLPLFEIDKF